MADFEVPDGEYITLTVRSLAGTEVNFPQVNTAITIARLKEMIFAEREEFPVRQQKLIKGSKTLENGMTLAECGLKNGDTVHLVKNLNESEDDNTEAGPKSEIKNTNDNMVTVAVPPGAGEGTRLRITPPGREQMEVIVPAGLRPGDRFRVRLPPRQQQQQQQLPTPYQPQQQEQLMQVRCPQNAHPGENILVDVPGRGRMRVQVPAGIHPGDMFRFRLPN